MRTLKAATLALLVGLPAQAETLDSAAVYISDGGLDGPCSCWMGSASGQICVDKTALNGPFLESRMVFWAQHGTNVTFAFYAGKCSGTGRFTIGTATTPSQ